ncbi:MAG: hypothetical protein FWG63_01380 [Defluviitaleaceae bacterium]|nr:hypothetical protein [Defluviitaleaceae bacterium]
MTTFITAVIALFTTFLIFGYLKDWVTKQSFSIKLKQLIDAAEIYEQQSESLTDAMFQNWYVNSLFVLAETGKNKGFDYSLIIAYQQLTRNIAKSNNRPFEKMYGCVYWLSVLTTELSNETKSETKDILSKLWTN